MPPKSFIWQHFEKGADKKTAKCRHCGKVLKTGGNTSNLWCHYQHKHHDSTLTKRGSVPEMTDRGLKQRVAIPSTSQSNPEESFMISDDEAEVNVSQVTIDKAFQKISSFKEGGEESHKVTQSIIYMICKDLEPLSIVEREGFRKLMKTVAPHYTLPSRKTIRSAIIEKYQYISNIFKAQLKDVPSYTLTTDIWTDSQMRSFISLTIHYYNMQSPDFNISRGTLGVFELRERHTSEYIAEQFKKLCAEWEIDIEK